MKNISTILTSTLILFAIACGSEGSSLEKQKASLASLKKESLSLNAKIASLESAIAKAGGAETAKAILVAVTPLATQDFTHYIELQGKVESESVSFVTPRAGGGQVKALFVSLPQYKYEHIFIDNCSNDKTVVILKEIATKDENIKISMENKLRLFISAMLTMPEYYLS